MSNDSPKEREVSRKNDLSHKTSAKKNASVWKCYVHAAALMTRLSLLLLWGRREKTFGVTSPGDVRLSGKLYHGLTLPSLVRLHKGESCSFANTASQ